MFGFSPTPSPQQGPWSGLPTGQSPYAGSEQLWQPAQQAPWRLSPWSTQGMPQAAPVQPIAAPAAPAPNPYLSQGTSAGIPGFNPMIPGGGFAPQAPASAPAPADPLAYWTPNRSGIGTVSNDPGFGGFALTSDVLAGNEYLRQQYDTRQNVLQGNLDQYNELHSLLAP